MQAQETFHKKRDLVRQLAAPLLDARKAKYLAEVKARREARPLAGQPLASSQHPQFRLKTSAGTFVVFQRAQEQLQPPPEILRQQSARLFADLRNAAEKGDVRRFSEICESTSWGGRSASEVIQAISLALKAGALMIARDLASAGLGHHSDSEELRKYARLLAPPDLLRTDLPSDPGLRANLAWLRQHRAEHSGRWVALKKGTLLAEGRTLQEVLRKVGSPTAPRGTLLTRVR